MVDAFRRRTLVWSLWLGSVFLFKKILAAIILDLFHTLWEAPWFCICDLPSPRRFQCALAAFLEGRGSTFHKCGNAFHH